MTNKQPSNEESGAESTSRRKRFKLDGFEAPESGQNTTHDGSKSDSSAKPEPPADMKRPSARRRRLEGFDEPTRRSGVDTPAAPGRKTSETIQESSKPEHPPHDTPPAATHLPSGESVTAIPSFGTEDDVLPEPATTNTHTPDDWLATVTTFDDVSWRRWSELAKGRAPRLFQLGKADAVLCCDANLQDGQLFSVNTLEEQLGWPRLEAHDIPEDADVSEMWQVNAFRRHLADVCDSQRTERPLALVVAGQPGSGRNTLLAGIRAGYTAPHRMPIIDPGDLLILHPQYASAVNHGQQSLLDDIENAACELADRILSEVLDKRISFALGALLKDPTSSSAMVTTLHELGYRVVVCALCVSSTQSWRHLETLPEWQRIAYGADSGLDRAEHQNAFEGLIDSLTELEKRGIVDELLLVSPNDGVILRQSVANGYRVGLCAEAFHARFGAAPHGQTKPPGIRPGARDSKAAWRASLKTKLRKAANRD